MGENSIKRCTSLIPSLLVKFGKCCGMYIIRKANGSARTIVFSFRRRWKLCAVSHEPHLPKKKKEISPGVICTVTHYTGLPRLMSCAGVTRRWRLLFRVKKNKQTKNCSQVAGLIQKVSRSSLIPRPHTAFRRLQYGCKIKSGSGLGTRLW